MKYFYKVLLKTHLEIIILKNIYAIYTITDNIEYVFQGCLF